MDIAFEGKFTYPNCPSTYLFVNVGSHAWKFRVLRQSSRFLSNANYSKSKGFFSLIPIGLMSGQVKAYARMNNMVEIEDRADLIAAYRRLGFSSTTASPFFRLPEPAEARRLRVRHARNEDLTALVLQDELSVSIEALSDTEDQITVAIPKNKSCIFEFLGIPEFPIIYPSKSKSKFLSSSIRDFSELFSKEIQFIRDFTKSLIWIGPRGDQYLGSAAFAEFPHCTFFSDAALFSVPPAVVVPRSMAAFAVIENLLHEALHHQMHAIHEFSGNPYIRDGALDERIVLNWRERDFTLTEALHALHVYSVIKPLRKMWLDLSRHHPLVAEYDAGLLLEAVEQAERMHIELGTSLTRVQEAFEPFWWEKINRWMG
jgi:hypothetical protein